MTNIKKYEINYCVICGKEIIKRKEESIKRYNQKKICSNECRKEYMKGINIKDLTGQKFGKLIVIKINGETNHRNKIWECQCNCNNITYVAGGDLTKKNGTRSCGKCSNNIFIKHDQGYWIGIDIKGEEFLFDEIDYEFIKKHTWNVDNKGYVMTCINNKKYAMHRLILNTIEKNITIDHINKCRNDNRRFNLRICELRKNLWNKNKKQDKEYTSKYIGVHWHIKENKWVTNIRDKNGKQKHLGEYDDEIDAAKAYDKECYKLRNNFAVLNFPEETNPKLS